jgi:hypothetical protein
MVAVFSIRVSSWEIYSTLPGNPPIKSSSHSSVSRSRSLEGSSSSSAAGWLNSSLPSWSLIRSPPERLATGLPL